MRAKVIIHRGGQILAGVTLKISITLKNDRCFSDERPATFSIAEAFTAFVVYNVNK